MRIPTIPEYCNLCTFNPSTRILIGVIPSYLQYCTAMYVHDLLFLLHFCPLRPLPDQPVSSLSLSLGSWDGLVLPAKA